MAWSSRGQAPSLAYLFIHGENVEMRPADHLRGKTPDETQTIILSEPGCATVWVASIGAAGENRVRFATISNEGRHAGRGGVGAVMGAKNLKAIAVSGDRATPVAYPEELESIADSLRRRSVSSVTDKYRGLGTVANLAVFNRLGTLPTPQFPADHVRACRCAQWRDSDRNHLQPPARLCRVHHPL